ncbi:head-tail adaptor protein [Flavobacterium sp. CYK-4]|uniref:phage head completion protein n=1 Tax=Flavobacterium lotistagni TaxID=2709660 RepID=UPI00140BD009|nr:head-tail adaptor protein [Flavobacterium lotistagni]NHM08004.1 head-tail adaptor protein [Flavobacterium lotistagni]
MNRAPFIGTMDRIVKIVKLEKSQSETGSVSSADEEICKPWAKLESDSGFEELQGKVKHTVKRSYIIRHNSDVAANGKNYVLIDNEIRFRITHVEPLGRRSHLKLYTELYE